MSHSELLWSVLSCIRTEYGEILRISPSSARMRENTNQNNSEYGNSLRSGREDAIQQIDEIQRKNNKKNNLQKNHL